MTQCGRKLSLSVLFFVAAGGVGLSQPAAAQVMVAAPAQGMMAAPDETPLLFDRLRAFSAVVVATTPAGFEKNPAPVKGTNCVYLPVKIEKVLKGDLKPGPFRLSVHEGLPPLLAERDGNGAGAARRYLLVMGVEKNAGYLGGGMLYKDLARFCLTDPGMEKLARTFLEANDVTPAALLKVSGELLADKDVAASASAFGHVCELLARLAAQTDAAGWKTLDKRDLQSAVNRVSTKLRTGAAVDAAAAFLIAVAARTDNPEGVKVLDGNLAEPARKWLTAQLEAPAQGWSPDYQRVAAMTPVVSLLGQLKDKDAKDLLVKQTKDERWAALRRPTLAAFKELLSPEEQKALNTPSGADFPRGIPRIKRIQGPLPPVPVE